MCLQRGLNIHPSGVFIARFGCYTAGVSGMCCRLGTFCVHHTTMHHVTSLYANDTRRAHACQHTTVWCVECNILIFYFFIFIFFNKQKNVSAWGVVGDMATGTPHLKTAPVIRPRGQYHRGQYHRGQYHRGQLKLHVLGSTVPPVVINAYHQSLLTRTTNRY